MISRVIVKSVKLSIVHVILIVSVIIYLLVGAYVFYRVEGDNERRELEHKMKEREKILEKMRNTTQQFVKFALYAKSGETWQLVSRLAQFLYDSFEAKKHYGVTAQEIIAVETLTVLENEERWEEESIGWNFGNSLLFAFTAITTIGYGHVSPRTVGGRVFCMIYSLVGIPLAMLVIADTGKFVLDGIQWLIMKISAFSKEKFKSRLSKSQEAGEEEGKSEEEVEEYGGGFLLILFIVYVIVGATLCPLWERWSFFDALYFCFVTLTTIGFGDIYPENLEFIFPSLLYITVGLALTTMTIEVCGTLFKKLHYLGAKLKNVKNAVIWFGGKNLQVMDLVVAVGKNYGIPEEELRNNLDLDAIVETTIQEKEEKIPPPRPPEEPEVEPLVKHPDVDIEGNFIIENNNVKDSIYDEEVQLTLPELLKDSIYVELAESEQVEIDCKECFELPSQEEIISTILPTFHSESTSVSVQASQSVQILEERLFEKPSEHLSISHTLPHIPLEVLNHNCEASKTPPPPEPVPQRRRSSAQAPANYKRSLSASLGLKLPTPEEQKDLLRPKKSYGQQQILQRSAFPHHNEHPFYLIRTSQATDLKVSDKCKHCHVSFPIARKGQKERGPRNAALLHWEKLGKEATELTPVMIHPWYQCLVVRYPYFYLDLLQIDNDFKEEVDGKHQQLLLEQLGIGHTDDIKTATRNWKENPEPNLTPPTPT